MFIITVPEADDCKQNNGLGAHTVNSTKLSQLINEKFAYQQIVLF